MSTKPDALIQVLDELRSEGADTTVVTIKGSHAKVYTTPAADPITLTREETELLLNTTGTVEMFHEALGSPTDAAIELHQISLDEDVEEKLGVLFSSVEEV